MVLKARLDLRQGQTIVVTPQLRQAISLLQLSNLELEAFIQGEMERNPLLARDEAPAEPEAVIESGPPLAPGAQGPEPEPHTPWARGGGVAAPLDEDLERSLAKPKTLSEHLEEQAVLAGFDLPSRAIASALIGAVDEAGYLRADLADIAGRLGCGRRRVEAVLERLQECEPVGVFARDLRECLMLQLKDRNRYDPAMAALLDNLALLARHDLPGLKRACGVDAVDLNEMIAELRRLTPRPGGAFGGDPTQMLVPDVLVRAGEDGLWRVELNAGTLPRLLVDRVYHAEVSAMARSDRERMFVSDCLSQAHGLLRSLDQRARTVLKVASEIVRRQDEFLAYGVERLRPLTLKAVADAIGMHESTVSRASANKVLDTPRGVFEMSFFFTSALPSKSGGEGHAAEAVRRRIKQLIEAEPAGEGVLSDDRIANLLQASGVDIARRTVAKYRESLRIPSSAERRRQIAGAL